MLFLQMDYGDSVKTMDICENMQLKAEMPTYVLPALYAGRTADAQLKVKMTILL